MSNKSDLSPDPLDVISRSSFEGSHWWWSAPGGEDSVLQQKAIGKQAVTRPIHATAGNHCGPRSQRGVEHYPTPACAVEALLRVEALPHHLLEPCDGDRAISRVLEAHGHAVTTFDLVRDGIDFLTVTQVPPGIGAAVTNPPFSKAAEIVRHALTLVPKVIILERIQFLNRRNAPNCLMRGRSAASGCSVIACHACTRRGGPVNARSQRCASPGTCLRSATPASRPWAGLGVGRERAARAMRRRVTT